MNFAKLIEFGNELTNATNDLEYEQFMALTCLMFNEYHRANHNSPTPPEMAQIVAYLIAQVNEEKGEY